jgi:D-lactate dehydrogenase (cytochrome)
VTRTTLERAAAGHGLFFPVDPGADATLGGMAATNAAGTTSVRYGKMRANVLALEAVLAGGRVVRAGSRAPKTSAGYDLLGLLVGSEGTLGVITELTLRLHGIPEQAVVLRLSFPDLEPACRAATAIVAAGAGVTRVELLDGWTIAALNEHQGTDLPVGPSLFVEASGSAGTVASDLELVTAVAESEGSLAVVAERDPTARSRLWAARHASAYAAAAAAPPGRRHRSTDVCVPLSELAGAVSFARAELDRRGLVAGIVGHAGDGNVHLSLMVDPDDPEELRASDELVDALVTDALARGGTCTGEHGIGAGKIRALEREHGDLLPLMRGVKQVFDPHGIMNPGKVLATSAAHG